MRPAQAPASGAAPRICSPISSRVVGGRVRRETLLLRRSLAFRTIRDAQVRPEPAVESLGDYAVHVRADPALHASLHHAATRQPRIRHRAFGVLTAAAGATTTTAPAGGGRSGRPRRSRRATPAPPRPCVPAARPREAATRSADVPAAGAAHRPARRSTTRAAGSPRSLAARRTGVTTRGHHHRQQDDHQLHDASDLSIGRTGDVAQRLDDVLVGFDRQDIRRLGAQR
jgi:hypothetical protein